MSVFTWFNMPTSDSQNGKEALGEGFGGHPLGQKRTWKVSTASGETLTLNSKTVAGPTKCLSKVP